MGHYNHPRELSTPVAQAAVRRIRSTGAQVRMQSPLIRRVNDDANAWAELWRTGVNHGAIPYYMFVERDTGPQQYFEVPLVRAWEIFRDAYQQVSGLARTVRGPSMSAFPGKVLVDGVAQVAGERVLALQLLQARNAEWVRQPFFARYDPRATWLDQLEPAFGESRFFFEREGTPVSVRRLAVVGSA
jgi:L-lysine 2,3-aminomutase